LPPFFAVGLAGVFGADLGAGFGVGFGAGLGVGLAGIASAAFFTA
jgi:hypothetical protein